MKFKNLGRVGKFFIVLFSLIALVFITCVLYIFFSIQKFTDAIELSPNNTNKLASQLANELARKRLKYIGKVITLDPKSRLVKVEHYGGSEVDKYFHIFHVNSDVVTRLELKVEKEIKIEKPIKFKVFAVDVRNTSVQSHYYCLLESSEFLGQVAQHKCEKLDMIPDPYSF